MSLAHPGIIEAGMSLREARREAWDSFVEAVGEYSDAYVMRMRTAPSEELVALQGMAISMHALHRMLAEVEKHYETLSIQKAKQR